MTTTQRVISFDVGIRHLAFAELDVAWTAAETRLRIVRWETIDLGAGVAGADVPAAVVQAMRARFCADMQPAACVLIENQPAFKNAAMKTVQVALHTYFVMAGGYAVRLVGAGCKHSAETLRLIEPPRPAPPEAEAASGSQARAAGAAYRARKAAAVRACERLLADVLGDDARAAWLRGHRKRDDLSDCLLQAVDHARRCGARQGCFVAWNGPFVRCCGDGSTEPASGAAAAGGGDDLPTPPRAA